MEYKVQPNINWSKWFTLYPSLKNKPIFCQSINKLYSYTKKHKQPLPTFQVIALDQSYSEENHKQAQHTTINHKNISNLTKEFKSPNKNKKEFKHQINKKQQKRKDKGEEKQSIKRKKIVEVIEIHSDDESTFDRPKIAKKSSKHQKQQRILQQKSQDEVGYNSWEMNLATIPDLISNKRQLGLLLQLKLSSILKRNVKEFPC